MLKPFSGEKNFKSRRNGAQNWRFWGKMEVETLGFGFALPCVKIGARVSAVAFLENPPPKKVAESLGVRNHACAEPKPLNRFG